MKKTTSELVPFDKVLVRDDEKEVWLTDLFCCVTGNYFITNGGMRRKYCIPYEGNEHLLKTSNPYIPPYRPQDGDFVYIRAGYGHLTIFKRLFEDCVEGYFIMEAGGGKGFADSTGGLNVCCVDDIREMRPATSAEIEKILSKVKEIGKKWNEEKKIFEDLEWKPEKGASYYAPCFDRHFKGFVPKQLLWHGEKDDNDRYYKERHLVFRTKEDCQPSCEKMNKAIEDLMSHE